MTSDQREQAVAALARLLAPLLHEPQNPTDH